jgi:tetratricopeptide (TPR) repeat protein
MLEYSRETSTVFEDEFVQVLYEKARGDFLLITFSELTMRTNGKNYWAQAFAQRTGTSALGFVAKGPNWFPVRSVEKAIVNLEDLLKGYPERVVYGHSMGGYAALRYGKALRAKTAISFCPQTTINPAETGERDRRYTSYFSKDIHAEMDVRPSHCSTRTFVFYDPFCGEDAAQLGPLLHAANVRMMKVSMSSHDTVRLFADSLVASELIEGCRRDDLKSLRELISRRRKALPTLRLLGIAIAAAGKHPRCAERIVTEVSHSLEPEMTAEVLNALAMAAMRHSKFADAERCLLRSNEVSRGSHALTMWRLSDLYKFMGRVESHLEWALRAARMGEAAGHLYAASLLMGHGRFEAAQQELQFVLQREPENTRARSLLEMLHEKRGDLGAAAPLRPEPTASASKPVQRPP